MEASSRIGTCTRAVVLTALLGGGVATATDRVEGYAGAGADSASLRNATATAATTVNAEELKARLRAAIEADEPEKVRRLMEPGIGANGTDSLKEWALGLAAEVDAVGVMSMLIEEGDVPGTGGEAWSFHGAIIEGDLATLIRRLVGTGTDVNQRNATDWTPLHWALIGIRDSRLRLVVVRKLIESGADVNVATAATGWTPLHIAALWNDSEIVEMLLASGARVNARSHIGGWTPLRLAERHDDTEEAAAVLRAAGGKSIPYDGLACLPSYMLGEWPLPRQCTSDAAQEQHDRFFHAVLRLADLGLIEWLAGSGTDAVPGSFTAPGTRERLVFETFGFSEDKWFELVSLVDRTGVSRSVMVRDFSMEFRRLCRDPSTGTDTVVFEKSYDGSCCPWDDTVYMHYDADAGTLTQAFVDRTAEPAELLDPSGACWWRAKREAKSTYEETISALRVGDLAKLGDHWKFAGGEPMSLPTRVIPANTVASALATLDDLSHDAARVTRTESGDSRRWKTIAVSSGRNWGYVWGGVALVWDGERKEWHSFYDRYHIEIMGFAGDKLVASAISNDCGTYRLGDRCYFEVDLTTHGGRRIASWEARDLLASAD